MLKRLGISWILWFCWMALGYSQNNISIHSENNQIIDATFQPATQYLNGDVKIYHANTFMYCDTAILRGNILKMRHNVVIMQNDTIRIFSDSLRYDGDSLVAYLYGDVILENGYTKKLYTSILKYDVKNKIAYYTQNARLEDQNSTIVSKRGKYALNQRQAFFYDHVVVTGDHFELRSDSITYLTTDQKVNFLGPVEIHRDSAHIYSEIGWFDLDDEQGDFIGNAQYLEGDKMALADTISYDGKFKKIALKSSGDGKLSTYISSQDTAYAQVITYDELEDVYTLEKSGYYKSKSNEVSGEAIFYNKKTEKFKVSGRSEIRDGAMHIKADTLDYDKTTQYGIALGHVIWRDTSAKTTLFADHVTYHGADNDLKVFNYLGRPLFAIDMDGDSLFMKADTFRSFRVIQERIIYPDKKKDRASSMDKKKDAPRDTLILDTIVVDDILLNPLDTLPMLTMPDTIYTGIFDTLDYFVGDGMVRMFKTDMQAVCDSLVFSKADSIFTLYAAPFLWSDSTQIAGDTIAMYVKASKVDRVKIQQNGSIISSEDLVFFDQIQGREIDAHFDEGLLSSVYVNGNTRLVYYLKDDEKAYIGVNTSESSTMTFLFKDKAVTDIKNYIEPTSKVYPMRSTNHEALKIEGFIWNLEQRPLAKENL